MKEPEAKRLKTAKEEKEEKQEVKEESWRTQKFWSIIRAVIFDLPRLFRGFVGDEKLPTYAGIVIGHYKDTH